VWFAYEGEAWVLRGVSFDIAPGAHAAIVGRTGSGKSTILGLLLGFYIPAKGRILIDGKEISAIDRSELRSLLSLVPQDAFIFQGSIEDNLALWRPTTEATSLESDPLLTALIADQNGDLKRISQGERQLVALARAARRSAPCWLMDEATAHLDPVLDRRISGLVSALTTGKTLVTISHRLRAAAAADQILVMHEGKLVERGDHASLIGKNGLYAKLYRLQQALGEPAVG
jgi:ATP-binding cassette subfamily C protein